MKQVTQKKPAKKLKPMDAASAATHMENLIAANEATAQDGRLEVATSIAMTSDMVTVDANTEPFTTTPANLFTLTFDDNQVGISTADLMRTFLANLKTLLPQIASNLDQIPENPGITIQSVVRFVRLALLQG